MDLNSSRVREMRTTKGWTQQQLAEISDLSLRTVQRVESQGVGSLETSKSLAAAFEIERELLLTVVEPTDVKDGELSTVSVYFLLASFFIGAVCGAVVLWLFG